MMTLRQRSYWGVLSVAVCAASILILYHCTVHAHTLLWEPYGYSELLINYSDGFVRRGLIGALLHHAARTNSALALTNVVVFGELRRAAFSIGVAGIPQGRCVAGLPRAVNSGRRVPHGGHVSDLLSQGDALLLFAGIVCDCGFSSASCTRACAAPSRVLRCVFYLVCKCRVCACARSVCLSGCAGDAVPASARRAYDAHPERLRDRRRTGGSPLCISAQCSCSSFSRKSFFTGASMAPMPSGRVFIRRIER